MKQYHRIRRLALQGLCCLDTQGNSAAEMAEEFINDSREELDIIVGARDLMREVFQSFDQCDSMLKKHCKHWTLERLAMVDRCILRIGCHELLCGSNPPKVIITEAIKLAREFSTAESPRFINGVLDAVHKDIQNEIK